MVVEEEEEGTGPCDFFLVGESYLYWYNVSKSSGLEFPHKDGHERCTLLLPLGNSMKKKCNYNKFGRQ